MKKISIRNLYLIFIICIGLVCLGIGSTYAVFTASSEIISPISLNSNLTYESGVLETINVKVLPGEVISTRVNITNSSNSNLNYVTWYIDEGYDINVVGETGDMQGVISPLSSSTIVVSVRNSSNYTTVVNIGVSSSEDSIVLGNNMKVVDSANFMMGVDVDPSNNTALFLRSNLQRGEIESITFVDNINIPEGSTSVDVSKHNDGTVMMWYGDKNSNNLYDVYIGAKNGTVFLSSGHRLFSHLTNTKTINFSNYVNTSNVTKINEMFSFCQSLTELDVSNYDTSNVTDMAHMFWGCSGLTKVDVSTWDTSKVTDMKSMFLHCNALKDLDVSGWNTSKVTTMSDIFFGCSSLTELNLSGWDTSNVTTMYRMFYNCENLIELDLNSWNTSNVKDMSHMFERCIKLTTIGDISSWNTSNVTDMSYMFNICQSLIEINVGNFNVSSVTDMKNMFTNCRELITIGDTGNWDTSNVTDMTEMFHICKKLEWLNVNGWNTNNVISMIRTFQSCGSLTEIDVSGWDTSKVINMNGMFAYSGFITLDLSTWDTSSVTDINEMFRGCTNITTIDLSGFDTNKVTDMSIIFENCYYLKTIYVSDKWSTESVSNSENMFNRCDKLVGGSGTTYDVNYIDKTYARVDGGTNNPGYFTYKSV